MEKTNEYKQCKRCVMDTTDSQIVFDEKGFCNHCTGFYEKTKNLSYQGVSSDEKLKSIVDKIKRDGQKNKYDCLIGISGGVDSCYSVYLTVKNGLRPLVVHMDNGWDSDDAILNIKNTCQKLGIDYQSYVLDWDEFKDIQLSYLKSSIPEIEMPTDASIQGSLHKVASQYNIKYIISGGNIATEGILPKSWFYDPKDYKLLKNIQRKFGTKKLKNFPSFDYISEIYYKFFRGIKIIYILNYISYSKNDAIRILENELGWKYYGGKHYESKYTGFMQSYYLPVKFNIDYRKATFSTMICMGDMTREEALEELKNKPYDEEKITTEIEYVSKKLGITSQEFNKITKLPVKSYKDYPNNEKFLTFLYNLYKKIYK